MGLGGGREAVFSVRYRECAEASFCRGFRRTILVAFAGPTLDADSLPT